MYIHVGPRVVRCVPFAFARPAEAEEKVVFPRFAILWRFCITIPKLPMCFIVSFQWPTSPTGLAGPSCGKTMTWHPCNQSSPHDLILCLYVIVCNGNENSLGPSYYRVKTPAGQGLYMYGESRQSSLSSPPWNHHRPPTP